MTWLITGGAGFIGANLADALLADGERVVVLDDLSREGSRDNLAWLEKRHGEANLWEYDVSNQHAAALAIGSTQPDVVVHLAAQVAVTTSLQSPRRDFETNALGTLNVLEACRRLPKMPVVLFASTNKVYGDLDHVGWRRAEDGAYEWPTGADFGAPETWPIEPVSPYGCSKAAADCYVRDYAASFGLPAAAFRLSCVYGPRQHGTADQGWVAHFAHAAARGEPVTIYGDGHQVRDALYVGDLVDLFRKAAASPSAVAGRAFNVGGGPASTLTPRRLLDALAARGMPVDASYSDWRPGDQRWYVSDTRAISAALGWRPAVGVAEGLDRLTAWVRSEAGEAVPV